MEGPSAFFPNAVGVAPKFLPTTLFDGNVAHSNGRAGLRTYPSGYRPRLNGGVSPQQSAQGINAVSDWGGRGSEWLFKDGGLGGDGARGVILYFRTLLVPVTHSSLESLQKG